MSQKHELSDLQTYAINYGDKILEREYTFRVLGIKVKEHLFWTEHIKSTYRHIKNTAKNPLNSRKQVVESLIFSKLG